jgi:flagellar basal-body rod protein FlgF
MAGGYYTALSGMRTRQDALDRLASDIANGSTAGYKTQRAGTTEAERPSFGAALQAAVDVTNGEARIDLRPGAQAMTGRSLDVAIEGKGFFVVDTDHGTRYTRNGQLMRRSDGVLTTNEGDPIRGNSGPIKIDTGSITIDPDGSVKSGGAVVGQLQVVEFANDAKFERDGASRFSTDANPLAVEKPSIHAGALEQSNVSVVERMAELTEVSRSFGTLLRAVTVLFNDVDRGAITELGKR